MDTNPLSPGAAPAPGPATVKLLAAGVEEVIKGKNSIPRKGKGKGETTPQATVGVTGGLLESVIEKVKQHHKLQLELQGGLPLKRNK